MKIIYLVPTNIFSGAENMTVLLAKEMKKEHQVFYASPQGPIEEYLREADIPHLPIEKISVAEIRRLYREEKPDIFHAVDFRTSTYCAVANIPFVAHLHHNPPWLKKFCLNSIAMLFFSFRAKKVICVSESVMDEYIFSKVCRKKSTVIPNVVDREYVLKKAKEHVPQEKEYDVGFVGRLDEPKDPIRFVHILEQVNGKRRTSAVIIGDGPLMEAVKDEIARKNLCDAVTVLGFQKNPYTVMKQIKVILMPSKWEGFGLTAVEGMLLGSPVLGTGVGGLKDVIGVESGNICETDEEFVNRICKFLGDAEFWQTGSEKAKIQAAHFCNREEYRKAVEKTYSLDVGTR